MHTKDHYFSLRSRHQPHRIEVIFVLESPPTSGNFFYDPAGRVTEPLFSAMMKLIGYEALTKDEGLAAFARKGFFLVDATYQPVNHIKNEKKRSRSILSDVPYLIQDLKNIIGGQRLPVKIVLVKANICRLLEEPLKANGINVINDGRVIPFPSYGNQHKFQVTIRKVLAHNKVSPFEMC